jgi:hypothetical protein
VILHTTKLDEEKSKHAGLAHQIGFWLSITTQSALARERRRNDVHLPAYKSVGNKYVLTSVSDWSIIMIGSGGLLVVVLHLCAVLFALYLILHTVQSG